MVSCYILRVTLNIQELYLWMSQSRVHIVNVRERINECDQRHGIISKFDTHRRCVESIIYLM